MPPRFPGRPRPRADDVTVFGRIKPGVTQQQIAAEFDPLLEKFRKQVPPYWYPEGRIRAKWVGVNAGILGKFAATLWVLFGSVPLLMQGMGTADVLSSW